MKEFNFKPENIYKFDEKGFVLGQSLRCRVVCRRGRKNPKYVQPGSREMVTVIETICADGTALQPFLIYKGKQHLAGWYAECNPKDERAMFATSPKGWTDTELGQEYLIKVFDPDTRTKYV